MVQPLMTSAVYVEMPFVKKRPQLQNLEPIVMMKTQLLIQVHQKSGTTM